MKKNVLWIGVSLALNLALAAGLLYSSRITGSENGSQLSSAPEPEPSVLGLTERPAQNNKVAIASAPGFHWNQLESTNYHEYVANLRKVGCPENTIRDIIVADLDHLYTIRIGAMHGSSPEPWHNATRRRLHERTQATKRIELQAEKRALVKQLIGYEWDNHANELWNQDIGTAVMLGFLPDEKAPKFMSLVQAYLQLSQDVKAAADDILIEEDRIRLSELYGNLRTEATRLLTPSEFEEVELRVQAAGFLSGQDIQFYGVPISGSELRELVRFSKDYQDSFKEGFLSAKELTPNEKNRRKQRFEMQFRGLLGASRSAAYERAQDHPFRETFMFVQERRVPEFMAVQIYEVCRASELSAETIRNDSALSPEEQLEALMTLQAETHRRLAQYLGGSVGEYLSGPGQRIAALAIPAAEPSNDLAQ
jgi:hypothetical protein